MSQLQRPFAAIPFRTVLGAVLAAGLTAACSGASNSNSSAPPASSPDTWAVVDGREISRAEVEKAFQRTAPKTPVPSEEEALTAKLSLLNEMILQDLLVAKAAALKLEVTDAEVDTAFVQRKGNMPDDAFQKELDARGLSVADMKSRPAPRTGCRQGRRARGDGKDQRHREGNQRLL